MNSRLIKTLKYALFLAIGILLLYLAFSGIDLQNMLDNLKNANYYWVALSMLCGVLAFISRGFRWLILIEPLGHKAKASNCTYAVAVGYLANIAVPRLGEIARCTALNQVEKIPVSKLFGTIIIERIIDFLILLLLIILTCVLEFQNFMQFFSDLSGEKAASASNGWMGYLLAFVIVMLLFVVLLYVFRSHLRKFPLYAKVKAFWQGLKEGIKSVFKMKKKGLFIIHTLIIWTMYYLMTYICFFCIPETAHLSPADGLFTMVVGSFGIIAPVQGGIGAYHLAVKLGLVALGVNADSALSFAFIVHTAQIFMTIVVGSFSMFMLSLAKRKMLKDEPAQ